MRRLFCSGWVSETLLVYSKTGFCSAGFTVKVNRHESLVTQTIAQEQVEENYPKAVLKEIWKKNRFLSVIHPELTDMLLLNFAWATDKWSEICLHVVRRFVGPVSDKPYLVSSKALQTTSHGYAQDKL